MRRKATWISLWRWSLVAAFALGGVATAGCGRRAPIRSGTGGSIAGGAGVGILGTAGGGGGGVTGVGGTGGGVASACAGASDSRLIVAGQRILRLTMNETLNTVRYLVGDAEA